MGLVVGRVASRTIDDAQDETWDWESDEALVVAAQANGAEFAILYQRYVDPVYRFCYRRLDDRAAAEDATSAVFERAIKALPRFKTGSFRAWLFTIARNTVTDAYRRNRGEQRLDAARSVADHRPQEFFTDDFIRRGILAEGPDGYTIRWAIQPEELEIECLIATVVEDGRIAEITSSNEQPKLLLIYVEQDGAWLIDEFYRIVDEYEFGPLG